jgi:hypothetical protein
MSYTGKFIASEFAEDTDVHSEMFDGAEDKDNVLEITYPAGQLIQHKVCCEKDEIVLAGTIEEMHYSFMETLGDYTVLTIRTSDTSPSSSDRFSSSPRTIFKLGI